MPVKTAWLDNRHVIFVKVVEGLDVVKNIEALGSASGKTCKTIVIEECGQVTSDVVTLENVTDTRTISTHILDINLGHSAGNVPVTISRLQYNEDWLELNQAVTDGDGRIHQLLDFNDFKSGIYKLKFHTQPYFQLKGVKSFYPHIEIVIDCESGQHYHIPLILARHGYTTYRGS